MRTLILLALLSLLGAQGVSAESNCSADGIKAGMCTVEGEVDEEKVTIEGTGTIGGPGGAPGVDDGWDGGDSEPQSYCNDSHPIPCLVASVTFSDIATFHPTPAVDHSQPNGWTVIGLDTNFYATGGQHVVDGILLGQPASVRFTPVHWNWDYGDGTTGARNTAGSPWATRTAEFGPTPTSHVYRQRGTFVVALDVDFAAEYRYAGGSWVPIAGTLTIPANPLTLAVGDAKTVLVEHNCRQDPAGPGCS